MLALLALLAVQPPSPVGEWRAVLDQAGGPLAFRLVVTQEAGGYRGRLCNGPACEPAQRLTLTGDSLHLDLRDFAASITARLQGDSLVGTYQNVGRRGPRVVPFRAARGRFATVHAPAGLAGRWDAWFQGTVEATPRVLEFRDGPQGLEGTVISNAGDYGLFWGRTLGDSVELAHFDGSNVYRVTARLTGDTLRGTFHAGLRARTEFTATRSTGRRHLTPPDEVTQVDTTVPFSFRFPDADGRVLALDDARFRGKVVLVDLFGTWCPACHDAAPVLGRFWRAYHARGLEVVGIAFEVTGDPAQDGEMVRRFRQKFDVPYPLLLGGASETDVVAGLFPQLQGFTAFPTTVFVGRDGKVRRVHAGFYGPATGAQHTALVADFQRGIEALLAEAAP